MALEKILTSVKYNFFICFLHVDLPHDHVFGPHIPNPTFDSHTLTCDHNIAWWLTSIALIQQELFTFQHFQRFLNVKNYIGKRLPLYYDQTCLIGFLCIYIYMYFLPFSAFELHRMLYIKWGQWGVKHIISLSLSPLSHSLTHSHTHKTI